MGHAKDKRPAEISGGMKQRVGIARALAMEPKVLLLDEPFGALDALTRAHLQDSVMAIHQKLGNTVLMITHDVDEAVLLSDHIVMMTNGPGGADRRRAAGADGAAAQAARAGRRCGLHPVPAAGAGVPVRPAQGAPASRRRIGGGGAMPRQRLLVVGNGMAGQRFLEELVARVPGRFDVTVIGAEPAAAYNRVLLTPLLAGEIERRDVQLRPASWYGEHGIELMQGRAACALDVAGRTVVLDNGQTLRVRHPGAGDRLRPHRARCSGGGAGGRGDFSHPCRRRCLRPVRGHGTSRGRGRRRPARHRGGLRARQARRQRHARPSHGPADGAAARRRRRGAACRGRRRLGHTRCCSAPRPAPFTAIARSKRSSWPTAGASTAVSW